MISVPVAELIARHGYWVVATIVALESMGIPAPGETALVTAAIYAGTTHRLSIVSVIIAAAIGAIAGDNIGYLAGRRFGYRLLLRYGPLLKLTPPRIKLGQFLFARHGGKVVFFGRFVAVLRTLAALLAGINVMPWKRFLFFNATGGIVWSVGFGAAGYVFGKQIERVKGPLGVVLPALAVVGAVGFAWFVRRHEAALEAEADRAMPGPLPPSDRG
ncbi:MAG TPA: DedA family protein [Vicinamibacterales bacterium]